MHGLAQVLSPAGAIRENERRLVQVPAGMGDRSRGPAPGRRAPQTLTSARGEGASAAQQPHELGSGRRVVCDETGFVHRGFCGALGSARGAW
jgi:hypothetical protein